MKAPLIIGILFSALAFAGPAPITIRVSGNPLDDRILDEWTLSPEGKATLTTVSVFPFQTETTQPFGVFETRLSPALHAQAHQLLAAVQKALSPQESRYPDSVIVEMREGEAVARWMWNDGRPALQAVENFYRDRKRELLSHPLKALTLICQPHAGEVDCFYKNIGKAALETADPLAVDNSLYCLSSDGKRRALTPHFEGDPQKLTPKSVKLEPNTSFSFKVKVSPACEGRVWVRTAMLRANRKYRDHILGDIYSNSIP